MLYQRGTTWWTQFKHAGKTIRKSCGTSDRRAAAIEAARIRVEYVDSSAPPTKGCKLEQLAGADILRAQQTVSNPSSVTALEYSWRQLLVHFGSDCDPEQIDYDMMTDYVQARRGQGAKGQTIRREAVAFARAAQIAYRRGWIKKLPPEWPVIRSDAPDPKQRGKWHPLDIVQKWIKEVTPAARDEILFTLYTGLRYTEIKKATAEWIEPAPPGYTCPAILRVPATAAKTRLERVIPLHQAALEILQRRKYFTPEKHYKTMEAAARRIGYNQNITMRDLRHIAATIAEQKDRKAAQDMLGHTTEAMTVRYLHSDGKRLCDASAAIVEALGVTTEGTQEPPKTELSAGGQTGDRTPDVQLVRLEAMRNIAERLRQRAQKMVPNGLCVPTKELQCVPQLRPGVTVKQFVEVRPKEPKVTTNDSWLEIVKELKEEVEK